MEIKFSESFFKSFKRYLKRDLWYNKLFSFLRYDLWWFFRNIFNFRKELYLFRSWDYTYTLGMLSKSLELQLNSLEKYSNEVDEDKLPKIEKIKRAIELINIDMDDKYLDIAEQQLGFQLNTDHIFSKMEESDTVKVNNEKLFETSIKIQNNNWDELFEILKGDENIKGSDIRGWWH